MKITIVHGSPRRGNTYRAVLTVKEEIAKRGDISFREFFLPQDMPEFCCGCFQCFMDDVSRCPHYEYTKPVMDALKESDGLIFATPVYVLAESGGMKAFLDHFGHLFIPHRPMPEMFKKTALVIATTAGAGTGHAISAVRRVLKWWGVRKVFACGIALHDAEWEKMSKGKKAKFEKRLRRIANGFYDETNSKQNPSLFAQAMFFIMRAAIKKWKFNEADYNYWKEKGWLGKIRPWKQKGTAL